MFASKFDPDKPLKTLICGAPAGHDARVLAEIAHRTRGRPVIHISLDDVQAASLAECLAFFSPEIEVIKFPGWDCLPYDRVSPHPDIAGQRIAALCRLLRPFKKPCVLLTTVQAIGQKTMPPEALEDASIHLATGAELPMEKLRRFLSANGYDQTGTVRETGEFAVRGGIVDLFPPGQEAPVRLDFFGDEIETMRIFDPLTQMTTGTIAELRLEPVSEVILNERTIAAFRSGYRELFGAVTENDPLYESITAGRKFPGMEHWLALFHPRLCSLFDYAPEAPAVFGAQTEEAFMEHLRQAEDFYQARLSLLEAGRRSRNKNGRAAAYKPLPVERMYLSREALDLALQARAVAHFSPFVSPGAGIDAAGRKGRDFATERALPEGDVYAAVREYANQQQAAGRRVVIACSSTGSAERMAKLLAKDGFQAHVRSAPWPSLRGLDIKSVVLAVLGLESGFVAPDLALLTEQDILGDRLTRPSRKRRAAAAFQLELGGMNAGDLVVHAEHGIGRYEGLETIHALGADHDCVKLTYAGGDKLYVPVENLDALSRYGSAESGAMLDKLGSAAWQARKARVKKRLRDMAAELLKIAAERKLKAGEIIKPPEGLFQEFAARFPYAETEDQNRAIEEVMEDLAGGKPMDRLVCGDVGFGKTEVALRAAFAVVQAGLQVAVVVPTTLLARQHFNVFSERFSGFPVRISQLSRMVTAAEAKRTRDLLKEGRIDIVIGTHALLGNDIGFRNLGLLIIDEEQRFGVKQKERLKRLRADVHVLTLTATPIPRTLQLALTGVRELSLMASPPVDRLAVRTAVLPYDPVVVREALMREHYRGGQSYYVCPRIDDLRDVSERLRELAPELKVVTAHGRMGAAELDDIMTAFDAGKFDVLLATNIVEAGLDFPNANTMIVHRAEMFGLAQLYQLRGRIGRAKRRGYAFLTYAPDAILAPSSLKRLEVIQTLDHLGAGFQLASHDMEIRGAGNLLGEEQSGHIREVGIELYQQMLEDAVAAARAGESPEAAQERFIPQISLGVPVLIPETYVPDLNIRMSLYRRLAGGADGAAIEAIAAEMIDRFGPLPGEVETLLQVVAIKLLCQKSGVAKVDAGARGAVIGFHRDKFANPERLIDWIRKQGKTARVRPDQKLVVMRAWDNPQVRQEGLRKLLEELAAMA